ncbi:hypothetical protein [Fusobacterium varium]|jgi:actin-related protein
MIYLILLFPMLLVIIKYWKKHSIGNTEMLEKLMTKEEFKKFKKDLSKLKNLDEKEAFYQAVFKKKLEEYENNCDEKKKAIDEKISSLMDKEEGK